MKCDSSRVSNGLIYLLLLSAFSCSFEESGVLQPVLLSYALQTNYETCEPERIIASSTTILDPRNDVRVGGFLQAVSAPGWSDIAKIELEETSDYLNIRISLDFLEDSLLVFPGGGASSVFIGSRIFTSKESIWVGVLDFGDSTVIRRNWDEVSVQVVLEGRIISSCGIPNRIDDTLEFKCDPKLWDGLLSDRFTGVIGETRYKDAANEFRDCAGLTP